MMVNVKCPFCHKRLMDVAESMFRGIKVTPAQQAGDADYQVKCAFCKNKINIKKKTFS